MSDSRCPCCGQTVPVPPCNDPDTLLAAMRTAGPRGLSSRREVYRHRDDPTRWVLTFGHHQNEPKYYGDGAVQELVERGDLVPVHDTLTYYRLA